MNSVTPINTTTSIAIPVNDDPYASYAAAQGGDQFGKRLTYSKGHWFHGEDEVAISREYLVLMRDAAIGWVHWKDKRPDDYRINFLRDNPRFADRATLGNDDKSQWERDSKGEPRDPWQQQHFLPMLDMENGELNTFMFSSHGGRKTFSELCRNYSAHRNSNRLPVISLQSSFYKHEVYGRVEVPVLKLERWEAHGDAPVETTKPRVDDPISTGVITKSKADMDDDIPF